LIKYEDLDSYRLIATKIIKNWRKRRGLPNYIYQSEDLLTDVTTSIIKADCTYDPSKAKKDLKAYRHICAINTIKNYVKAQTSTKKPIFFTDYGSDDCFIAKEDQSEDVSSTLRHFIYNSGLSQKQITIIEMVASGMNTREISVETHLKTEDIRNHIRVAIKKMKAISS